MKKIIIPFFLILSTFAFADSSHLIHETNEYVLSSKKEFKVNVEMNRAWIEIITYADAEDVGALEKVKVKGLTYNPLARAIEFEHEGQIIECAKIKQTRLFKQIRVIETGSCDFFIREITKKVDDGFEVKEITITQFFLLLK